MKNAIALLGKPNSGKSTVYNALTGSRQHVGNWPGKTVEKNDGFYTYKGTCYTVTDLPGSYGLSGNSDEEIITVDFIKAEQADLVCILVDASQLERSMYMVAEFAALDKPAMLLLNMMDVAKAQKKEIDHKLLEQRLGIPVLPFIAAESKGYDELKALLATELEKPHKLLSKPETAENAASAEAVLDQSKAKYQWISMVLESVPHTATPEYKLSKFDRVATSPVKDKFLCFGVVLLAFLVVMIIMSPFMAIGQMIPAVLNQLISDLLNGWHVHPWLVSVFSMMLPNVVYFCISMASFVFGVNLVFGFLEEIGFLARQKASGSLLLLPFVFALRQFPRPVKSQRSRYSECRYRHTTVCDYHKELYHPIALTFRPKSIKIGRKKRRWTKGTFHENI